MPAHRFPPPWSIEELNDACVIVRDNNWAAMRQKNVIKKHFRKLMHSP